MSVAPAAIEQSFRAVLAAALGSAVSLRCFNEKTDPQKAAPLPAVILTAKYIGRNYTIKKSGVFADDLELSLACRVDGTKPLADRQVEALAAQVNAAIFASGAPFAGWQYLRAFPAPVTPGLDANTHLRTLNYQVTALSV